MQTSEAAILFDHLYWMRDPLLEATARLSAEEFTARSQTEG